MKAKQLLITLFMAIAFISCEKEEKVEPDKSNPAPTYNTEYTVTSDAALWYIVYMDEGNEFKNQHYTIADSVKKWSKKLNMGIGDTLLLGTSTTDPSKNFNINVNYTGAGTVSTTGNFKDGDKITYYGVIMAE